MGKITQARGECEKKINPGSISRHMRLYDFKRGHRKGMDEIRGIMEEIFHDVREENGKLVASYKGLERIEVWLEGKKLAAETRNREVSDEEALDTLKTWNEFLFRVTGYTAKERKKKMTKT